MMFFFIACLAIEIYIISFLRDLFDFPIVYFLSNLKSFFFFFLTFIFLFSSLFDLELVLF